MEIFQNNYNEPPRGQSRWAAKEQRSPVVWPPSKTDTRRPHHDSLTPHSALATVQHPATSGGAFKTQRRPLAAARASSSRSSAPGPACARRERGRRGRGGEGGGGWTRRCARAPPELHGRPGSTRGGIGAAGGRVPCSGSRHGRGHGRRPGIPRSPPRSRARCSGAHVPGRASPAGRRGRGGGGARPPAGPSLWRGALSLRPRPPLRPGPPRPPPRPVGPRAEARSASPPPEEVPARSRRAPAPHSRPVGDFLRTQAPGPRRKKMQTFLKGKRVGYWLSEKKVKKLNFQAFAELCRKRGIEVVQLNLSRPIEEQGPLDVIIHKLTDVILEADQNDSQSLELVHRFQEYTDAHPETIVLDPLPAIRTLLDRSKSYELIRKIEAYMKDDRICSPPFMELTSLCGDDTMRLLEQNGLAFPFICKTRVAHGTNSHEMAIVFNQEGLNAIQPPCVVQNFINHNAVLYKVFVVGESYTVVQRPSLKNFSAGTSDRESIFFNSHNVSKPESSSVLTELDKIEGVFERPSDEVIRELSRALRQALGVSLFGIDIIINNQTGQHAVIDVNAFPGYEGVSEFFTDLLNHIATVLQGQSTGGAGGTEEVAPLRHNRLPAEAAGSLAGERTCSASPGCCSSMKGQDAPWKTETEPGTMGAGGSAKLPHQRLGCTTGVSPSFQQHCVASLATKASSQ